jgi:hypothetical protein
LLHVGLQNADFQTNQYFAFTHNKRARNFCGEYHLTQRTPQRIEIELARINVSYPDENNKAGVAGMVRF